MESVADGKWTRSEVNQKRRHREGGEPANAFAVGGADGVCDRRKSADTRRYHGCGALARSRVLRLPIGLRDRFFRRHEREQDETIHLALVLARGGTIRIEAAFGILSDVWHLAALALRSAVIASGRVRMPDRPASRRDQLVSTLQPSGDTAPIPVTTIRRIDYPASICALRCLMWQRQLGLASFLVTATPPNSRKTGGIGVASNERHHHRR